MDRGEQGAGSGAPGAMAGRRILVVGASSGIGEAFARAAARRGARLLLAARRRERLEALAEELGARARPADVRREEDCRALAVAARAELGGLDALLYATGITPLAPLDRTGAARWREVLETNLLGACLVARAALEVLEPGGLAAFLSSDSVGRPRHGLVPYSASKAALDEAILGFRREHPGHRFTRITVGPTIGTEIANAYDAELAAELFSAWLAEGFMTERMMEVAEVGELLADVVATVLGHPGISVSELTLQPPGGRLSAAARSAEDFVRGLRPGRDGG